MWFEKCDEPFFITFELLRIQEERDGRYNCGGRFLSATAWQEMLIRQFVFRMESGERDRHRRVLRIIRGERDPLWDGEQDESGT